MTVKAASQTVEIKLFENDIDFGNVLIGSRLKKSITMANNGDVPVRYIWNLNYAENIFNIWPEEDIILPNQEV